MSAAIACKDNVLQYSELNEATCEIRLFTLHNITADGTLCGTLSVVSLRNTPSYVALSYVWGTDPPRFPILINGAPFMVRRNLLNFLVEAASKEFMHVALFVDAICINQDNILERDSQVNLMGDIYRTADRVVAWIGTPLADHPKDRASKASEARQRCQMPGHGMANGRVQAVLALEDDMICRLLLAWLDPYWTRVWVVQEVLLARSLSVQSGPLSIDVELMITLMSTAIGPITKAKYDTAYSVGQQSQNFTYSAGQRSQNSDYSAGRRAQNSPQSYVRGLETLLTPGVRLLSAVCERQAHGHPQDRSQHYPMHVLLVNFEDRECSEPHDVVFGLLGIADTHIKADYSISITELYMHVLIEGLLDIRASTADNGRCTDMQFRLCLACMRAFKFSITHTTIFHLTKCAYEYCSLPDSPLSSTAWIEGFYWQQLSTARTNDMLLYRQRYYLLILSRMPGLGPMVPLHLWYQRIRASTCYRLQNLVQMCLRWNDVDMSMPDGQLCSYSAWIEEVRYVANRVQERTPPGRPSSGVYGPRSGPRKVQSRRQRAQHLILAYLLRAMMMCVDVLFGLCISWVSVRLSAWLEEMPWWPIGDFIIGITITSILCHTSSRWAQQVQSWRQRAGCLILAYLLRDILIRIDVLIGSWMSWFSARLSAWSEEMPWWLSPHFLLGMMITSTLLDKLSRWAVPG